MWWLTIVGGVVGLGLVLWLFLLLSLRLQFEPGRRLIRRMNRRLWNPRAMRKAGQTGAYASIVHHVGRKTGRPYQTPVGIVDTGEKFIITLPYGTTPDWLKNLLQAGRALITHNGATYRVDEPLVVGIDEAASLLTPKDRRVARLYGVRSFLMLDRVAVDLVVDEQQDRS
jgi:deazaflavin-dependent oxidoreductase (nitroreductase family)